MRYDRFLRVLEQTKAKYEQEIRKILQEMAREDAEVERVLRKHPDPPNGVSAHASVWTPARRRKQARLMKARMRAKHAHAKATP